MPQLPCLRRALPAAAVTLAAVLSGGCGDRLYPVHGTVALEDGAPLTKGMVICERFEGGDPLTVQGVIQPDGTFQLGTTKPGDGAPPGRYHVLINPMDISDVPDDQKDLPFDAKYLSFKTSGLEIDVARGDNDHPIRLAKSARRKPR